MNQNLKIIFVLFVAALTSCSKMPIYQSKESPIIDQNEFPLITTDQNNKSNDVSYGIANNETDLYFKAIFHDQQNLINILRGGGVNIYFDASGKKKKNYQLKIERSQKQEMAPNNIRQQYGSSREGMMQNMPAIISKVYDKVTWDADGEEFVFNRNVLKDPIKVELGPGDLNELVLAVKIPIKELDLPEGQDYFNIGIETNTVSSEMNGRPGGAMKGGRGGGKPGGGGGGQRGGGGSGGAGPKGGNPGGSGSASSSGMSPVKVWFRVEL